MNQPTDKKQSHLENIHQNSILFGSTLSSSTAAAHAIYDLLEEIIHADLDRLTPPQKIFFCQDYLSVLGQYTKAQIQKFPCSETEKNNIFLNFYREYKEYLSDFLSYFNQQIEVSDKSLIPSEYYSSISHRSTGYNYQEIPPGQHPVYLRQQDYQTYLLAKGLQHPNLSYSTLGKTLAIQKRYEFLNSFFPFYCENKGMKNKSKMLENPTHICITPYFHLTFKSHTDLIKHIKTSHVLLTPEASNMSDAQKELQSAIYSYLSSEDGMNYAEKIELLKNRMLKMSHRHMHDKFQTTDPVFHYFGEKNIEKNTQQKNIFIFDSQDILDKMFRFYATSVLHYQSQSRQVYQSLIHQSKKYEQNLPFFNDIEVNINKQKLSNDIADTPETTDTIQRKIKI